MASDFYPDRIRRIYDRRRILNRHEEEERYRRVCEAIPEFESLNLKRSDIIKDNIKRIVLGDTAALNDTNLSISGIEEEKHMLLEKAGFPSDYLDRIYTCSDCKDTGYIGDKRCHCFQEELLNILCSQSDLKTATQHENFANFNIEYYPDDYLMEGTDITPRDNIRKILTMCRDFIDNFSEIPDNLLIYGHSGVGKTFLSNCIAKEILDRGYTVIYLTSYQLFDILETKVFHREELDNMASGILSMLGECDLLIIDDLGTEMINKFTEVQLFMCMQERINNNLSTIISTNLSFDDINSTYSERIFSRLMGHYRLVKMTGHDIRIKKALEHS